MKDGDPLDVIKQLYSWDWMGVSRSFGIDFTGVSAGQVVGSMKVPELHKGVPIICANTNEERLAYLIQAYHQQRKLVRGAVIGMMSCLDGPACSSSGKLVDSYDELWRHLALVQGAPEVVVGKGSAQDCENFVRIALARNREKTVLMLYGLEKLKDGSQSLVLHQMASLRNTSVCVTTSRSATEINGWLNYPGGCLTLGWSQVTRGTIEII